MSTITEAMLLHIHAQSCDGPWCTPLCLPHEKGTWHGAVVWLVGLKLSATIRERLL